MRSDIELRLKDKQLSVGNRSLDLDPSLFYAGVARIPNEVTGGEETAMELKYRNSGGEVFLDGESEKIYKFLQAREQTRPLDVNPCPDEMLPTIAITGNFRASVMW